MENIQYIKTTRKLTYQEFAGRFTTLEQGAPGFVLSVDRIENLIEPSEKQLAECLKMLEEASISGRTLVLLQGRPCILDSADFILCAEPKISPVPNQIF